MPWPRWYKRLILVLWVVTDLFALVVSGCLVAAGLGGLRVLACFCFFFCCCVVCNLQMSRLWLVNREVDSWTR
jgi:hypothetical protein